MRIAFAGTHRSGKSTLVAAVAAALPGHTVVDEPYRLLEEDGHDFADPPSREDFELQLRRSIAAIATAEPDTLFDRSPYDFIAYLDEAFDLDDWPELADAMTALDAIVLVGLESPDRIVVPAGEDRRWRRRIDAAITALVLDDPHGFGVRAIEVSGPVDARVAQVVRALQLRQ